jgi:multidrug efflux pump subunit AcrA (membrane-fusion protein)
MKMKIWISVVILAAIVAAGITYWKRTSGIAKIAPREGEVVEAIYGLGTVLSDKVYHLRGGLPLQLRKLLTHEGASVKPGDALAQLDDRIFPSPIAGTVTALPFKDGELVPPQTSIVTVTNLEALFLEVSLEQQSVLRVKKDQRATISFESLRNEKVEGRVSNVYPRDSQFIVRINIEKWPQGVLPGMTADVAIEVGKKAGALLIPVKSVVAGMVTRIRDGKREKVPVKLGVIDGEWAEVISENLTPQDFVLFRSP